MTDGYSLVTIRNVGGFANVRTLGRAVNVVPAISTVACAVAVAEQDS